jgi:hypothetical protein
LPRANLDFSGSHDDHDVDSIEPNVDPINFRNIAPALEFSCWVEPDAHPWINSIGNSARCTRGRGDHRGNRLSCRRCDFEVDI